MCCFQVYGQQNRLQKYCKFFYKQHTIDKFDAVIAQLDEHSERAWQLADTSDMPVRRRETRSSFSQGLQRDSSGLASADSVEFEKAVRPGNCSISHPSQCCASAAEFLSAALFLSTSDFCKCGTALVVVSTHTKTPAFAAAWRCLLSFCNRSPILRDATALLADAAPCLIQQLKAAPLTDMRSCSYLSSVCLISCVVCDVTDAVPYHTAALTRCRLRRGTRHNGVRCMVFIDPETSKHAGTQGHVSLCGLRTQTAFC